MEAVQQNENEVTPVSTGCISCGNPVIVKGFPNALCESCRESHIKYPIPTGIKIFAVVIVLVFLFSMYKIPNNIGLGIHLDKGLTAANDKKYLTAQRELQKVVDKVPDNIEAQSNLLIASFYNQDFATFGKMYNQLAGQNFEDEGLLRKVEAVIKESASYFPGDSFSIVLERYKKNISAMPDTAISYYIASHPEDAYAPLALASQLFDKKLYPAADSVLRRILRDDTQNIPALNMIAVLKREQGKADESIKYLDRILSVNKESVMAIASKARTFLKQKKDTEALALAQASYKMDEHSYYAAGSLAMVYHFTNKTKERDAILNKLTSLKDTTSIQMLQYVKDVISGKEFFRN